MTKRELIQALESSSVEDWAPVMVAVDDPTAPLFDPNPRMDVDITHVTTIHTNKVQEIIIGLED